MRRARELLVREAQGVAFTSDPRGMARGSRSDRSRRQYVDSPDGGWGWMIVLHFFLVNVFVMGTLKSFGFFFIAFQQEFLENAERTTWIGSIMSCLRLSAGPLGTVACGKLGEMGTAVLGALLVACGFLFTTMVNSVSLIYITLGMLVGLGFAFLYQSASIMIARYFKAKLSTAYAISRSGMGLTFALAPFIQLLLEQYGWRGCLLILGGLTLNLVPSGLLLRPIYLRADLEDGGEQCTDGSEEKAQEVLSDNDGFIEKNDKKGVVLSGDEDIVWVDAEKMEYLESTPSLGDEYITCSPDAAQDKHKEWNRCTDLEQSLKKTKDSNFCSDGDTDVNCENNESLYFSRPGCEAHQKLKCEDDREFCEVIGDKSSKPCTKGPVATEKLLDLALLFNPVFHVYTWTVVLCQLAYFIPYFHLAARAQTLGISPRRTSIIIALAGITETVAQLMSGWLADQNYTRRTHYLKVYLLLCGVLTLISPLATTFLWLLVYAICFAVFCGGYLPLLLPVMVDMLGVHKVRSVYGLSMFFVGFGCLTGPPAAAWLYDVTQTYSSSFYLAGSGYLLSFLLLLFEPLAYRYQKSHQQVGSGES
uniref:monocarboxylate transporter 5 isoform X2 n=1 Tax=Myxine glutinosa TaxID=7769 RepID=UPI00358E23A3